MIFRILTLKMLTFLKSRCIVDAVLFRTLPFRACFLYQSKMGIYKDEELEIHHIY